MAPVLALERVSCTFLSRDDPSERYTAVDGTTLVIGEGEFVSVVGPTGCGVLGGRGRGRAAEGRGGGRHDWRERGAAVPKCVAAPHDERAGVLPATGRVAAPAALAAPLTMREYASPRTPTATPASPVSS